MDSTKKLNTWLVKCWMMQKKNQFKKILQGKKKYNNKKKIGFERKKLKNDETTKKKIAKII
jgi:hypothetical protein